MTWQWLVACAVIAIPFAILVDASVQNASVAEAMNVEEIEVEPKVVQLQVITNWTPERIEQEIRTVFHEAPNTAVAIAKCESGLDYDIQSHHVLSYGREQSFGVFQIHAKDHDKTARRLGYEDYKTDVKDNLAMARYLYDRRGNFKDWTCYNTGAYKKFL